MGDYFATSAISNSSLGFIDPTRGGNPRYFRKFLDGLLPPIDNKSFEMGTLIHNELLEPGLLDIITEDVPTPKVRDVIDAIWSRLYSEVTDPFPFVPLEALGDETLLICIPSDFYPKWGEATKIKKILTDGSDYWESLYNTRGKTIVESSIYHTVLGCVESIRMNPMAKMLIEGNYNGAYEEGLEELEVYWKTPWLFMPDGGNTLELEMKSKIDRVLINHTTKEMLLIDLKTTRSPLGIFGDTVLKYEYHRQMAFYEMALKEAYPEYTLLDVFIVAVQTNKEYPCEVFRIDKSLLDAGWARVVSLLDRVAYHTSSGRWGNTMESDLGDIITLKTIPE